VLGATARALYLVLSAAALGQSRRSTLGEPSAFQVLLHCSSPRFFGSASGSFPRGVQRRAVFGSAMARVHGAYVSQPSTTSMADLKSSKFSYTYHSSVSSLMVVDRAECSALIKAPSRGRRWISALAKVAVH
jgi:hypothetical protein